MEQRNVPWASSTVTAPGSEKRAVDPARWGNASHTLRRRPSVRLAVPLRADLRLEARLDVALHVDAHFPIEIDAHRRRGGRRRVGGKPEMGEDASYCARLIRVVPLADPVVVALVNR